MIIKPTRRLHILRAVLWTALALVLTGVLASWLVRERHSASDDRPFAAPFVLTGTTGQQVTEKAFLGKPSAWFFGFTNCPNVCPTALADMARLLNELGPESNKLNVIFVTVDPERDTPAVMKEYVAYFHPQIVGLTGDLQAVTRAASARYIYFRKVPLEDGSYTMDHTGSVLLATSDGSFAGSLDNEESWTSRVAKVKRLISDT